MEGQEGSAPVTGVYARKSTGLVREGGAWSVLIYNINFVSIGMMTLFTVLLIPAFYPGGNMQLALLICLVVVLPTSMVFAMFSAAMPRSGGDYVYGQPRARALVGDDVELEPDRLVDPLRRRSIRLLRVLRSDAPVPQPGRPDREPGLIDFGDRLSTPTPERSSPARSSSWSRSRSSPSG